jgi:hypothetical protein
LLAEPHHRQTFPHPTLKWIATITEQRANRFDETEHIRPRQALTLLERGRFDLGRINTKLPFELVCQLAALGQ